MSASADSFFQGVWYQGRARWLSWLLAPLSWLFHLIVFARRAAFRAGLLPSVRVSRPVIVIGNITVGGTGKTPFTIWLANELQSRGRSVGIVLRGYGGRSSVWPRDVHPDTPWEEVGDEAVLLAQSTGAIVVAGPDRVADARRAIERGADIVLSDDGLQHYRLVRDREIAVIDARRLFGNGRMLPAGPLREPQRRLAEVDLTVVTDRANGASQLPDNAVPGAARAVATLIEAVSLASGERVPLEHFRGKRVYALAGIGNPEAFFEGLRGAGIDVVGRALPDHAQLSAEELSFPGDEPVLMTEKDAVKCRALAGPRHWAVRLGLVFADEDSKRLGSLLDPLVRG
ncbi:MAG TPA: tetraacyldisaccharide 4'-kinase [Steroidobacteraceae bacterium]